MFLCKPGDALIVLPNTVARRGFVSQVVHFLESLDRF
jgi:hypothetical protein